MSQTKSLRATVGAMRIAVIAALVLSAYIHLKYAHFYSRVGNDITQGTLFKLQGALAIAAAIALGVNARLIGWGGAALVLVGSFGAIMAYRYINIGAIGPLPSMYEPVWNPQGDHLKVVAAIAEGAGSALALVGLGGVLMRSRKGNPAG